VQAREQPAHACADHQRRLGALGQALARGPTPRSRPASRSWWGLSGSRPSIRASGMRVCSNTRRAVERQLASTVPASMMRSGLKARSRSSGKVLPRPARRPRKGRSRQGDASGARASCESCIGQPMSLSGARTWASSAAGGRRQRSAMPHKGSHGRDRLPSLPRVGGFSAAC
jgi:hypothetical protein